MTQRLYCPLFNPVPSRDFIEQQLTAITLNVWHIATASTESTHIIHTPGNLSLGSCKLSLGGVATLTGRIVGIVASSVIEDQEIIARDTFIIWTARIHFVI